MVDKIYQQYKSYIIGPSFCVTSMRPLQFHGLPEIPDNRDLLCLRFICHGQAELDSFSTRQLVNSAGTILRTSDQKKDSILNQPPGTSRLHDKFLALCIEQALVAPGCVQPFLIECLREELSWPTAQRLSLIKLNIKDYLHDWLMQTPWSALVERITTWLDLKRDTAAREAYWRRYKDWIRQFEVSEDEDGAVEGAGFFQDLVNHYPPDSPEPLVIHNLKQLALVTYKVGEEKREKDNIKKWLLKRNFVVMEALLDASEFSCIVTGIFASPILLSVCCETAADELRQKTPSEQEYMKVAFSKELLCVLSAQPSFAETVHCFEMAISAYNIPEHLVKSLISSSSPNLWQTKQMKELRALYGFPLLPAIPGPSQLRETLLSRKVSPMKKRETIQTLLTDWKIDLLAIAKVTRGHDTKDSHEIPRSQWIASALIPLADEYPRVTQICGQGISREERKENQDWLQFLEERLVDRDGLLDVEYGDILQTCEDFSVNAALVALHWCLNMQSKTTTSK